MTESLSSQWTLLLSLTALLLSLAVLAQIASRYAAAYLDAPRDVQAFLDAVDSSVAENESYDRDVSRVTQLEDKLRLGHLLREIQRRGDDLREDLSALMVDGGGSSGGGGVGNIDRVDGDSKAADAGVASSPSSSSLSSPDSASRLRASARVLWAAKRTELEDKLRGLDMLRMRFLVVHMSIIAGAASEAAGKQQQVMAAAAAAASRDPEKAALYNHHQQQHHSHTGLPRPGALPRALTDSIKTKPPLRRLTTQAIGHPDNVEGPPRVGWVSVVQELQGSPRMHRRHASIEMAMAASP